jgi:predicted ester cyclase
MKSERPELARSSSALEVVAEYSAALAASDSEGMDALRGEDFALDLVHRDAFESAELSRQETKAFWPSWFASFPEMDYQVTRTIAAEEVVVTQWVFMGTNTGPLTPPVFGSHMEPTGKTIRFRGVSLYDVRRGLIQREMICMDMVTLYVELGVNL